MKKPNKKRDFLIGLAVVVGIVIVWFAVTATGLVKDTMLPSPVKVWQALVDISVDGYKGHILLVHLGVSFYRLFTAFLLAILTAVPLGLVSGYNDKVNAVFEPIIEFYRPLPPLAYYTLLVLWMGIEN